MDTTPRPPPTRLAGWDHGGPTPCPESACATPAAIVDSWSWPSSDGIVDHVRTSCVDGHVRTVPVDWLHRDATSHRLRAAFDAVIDRLDDAAGTRD